MTRNAAAQDDDLVRLLMDSTGEGIYGIDLEGNCTFANAACAKLLGFETKEELLGRQMHELVHHTRANGKPYPVEECRIYQAVRDRKGTHVDDEVMFTADGVPFSYRVLVLPGRAGRGTGRVCGDLRRYHRTASGRGRTAKRR